MAQEAREEITKAGYLKTQLLPIGSLENGNEPSYWQLIFLQSKANGCLYSDEDLPDTNWHWPKNTWLQERLGRLRKNEDCCHA